MRFYCLACEIFARPIYSAAANSPHAIDIHLLPLRMHEQPGLLNEEVLKEIDLLEGGNYDAILLGYGLCGNWLTTIKTGSIPLVLPKMHDCIAILLGSNEEYASHLADSPGTYWYSRDFIERGDSTSNFAPIGAAKNEIFGKTYESLCCQYGEDNAEYLLSVATAWERNYQRAVWLEPGVSGAEVQREISEVEAAKRKWKFEIVAAKDSILVSLLHGAWLDPGNHEFTIVPPESSVRLSFDNNFHRITPPNKAEN